MFANTVLICISQGSIKRINVFIRENVFILLINVFILFVENNMSALRFFKLINT